MDKKDVTICRCEEIKREEIIEAIRAGCISIDSIKRRTRAGMGFCQGKTCSKLIAKIISEETGISISQIKLSNRRPPIGAITIDKLAVHNDKKE